MIAQANGSKSKLVNAQDVAATFRLFVRPGCIAEVRALDATTRSDSWRPSTFSGYFDDADKLATAVSELASATGIYFTFNEPDPALLARAVNRLRKSDKGTTTSDGNIIRRRYLLIDCDVARPAGISSTDAEHEASLAKAREIDLYLHDRGWPDPILADSGNGTHLIYAIDLPADDEGLVSRVLVSLATEFDDAEIVVDRKVFNPARITKLYGTLVCKGDSTPDRPHRFAKIIDRPETIAIVTREQLEELAGPAPKPAAAAVNGRANGTAFDLTGFIARNNLDVTEPGPWNGGTRWELKTSPFCDHGGDGPYILQHATGAISASCHHNSCSWTWADLRARLEPKPERTFDGGDRYVEAKPAPDPSTPIAYKIITCAELAKGDYSVEFLIDNALAAKQPLILAGAQKVLKTSIIIDLAISLAIAGYFLGRLRVNRAVRVGVMTGESGLGTIQENAHNVCKAAGVWLDEITNLFWSEDLPKLGEVAHLEAVRRFLTEYEIEVLVVDPAYLCMPSSDSGNVFAQGELLRGIAEVCRECGCMLVLAHHTRKNTGRDPYDVPELSDIAWSGFAEFARQWWLIGRREKYGPGTGSHRLWLSIGGSAGHSALWAVDVEEGLRTDPEGRKWDVDIHPPSEARAAADSERDQRKEQREAESLEKDKAAACRVLAKVYPAGLTKTAIRDQSGLARRIERTIEALLEAGDIEPCEVTISNQKTPRDGYRLLGDENA